MKENQSCFGKWMAIRSVAPETTALRAVRSPSLTRKLSAWLHTTLYL